MRTLTALCALAIAASPIALADGASTVLSAYTLSDFEQYAPTTAYDMVRRIPGFSIDDGNDGSRGFGEASGNVLINGQRISGKSNTASDALGRIPADNVTRIEIVDGASLDIPGLSGQVANVVAETDDGITGAWRYRMRFRENLPPFYDFIDASATGKFSPHLTWTVGIESDPGRGANKGRENVFDGDRNLTRYRIEENNFISDHPIITGGLAWAPENGHIANLNAEFLLWQAEERELSDTFLPNGDHEGFRLFMFSEDEWSSEVSGDYEFDFGPGRLKLIALDRREHSPIQDMTVFRAPNGDFINGSRFQRTIDEGETIARTEYGWSTESGVDWQISAEGAFNFLDSESALFTADATGDYVERGLRRPNTRVEEKRAEAFLTRSWEMSDKLNLQAALGVEYSELSSETSENPTRGLDPAAYVEGGTKSTFTRPKGYVSASYDLNETTVISARLEREVGQLNFFDFVSTVNIEQGVSNTGNLDLVPDQTWLVELEVEKNFGDLGAGTLRLYHEHIEDVVDRIPFGGSSEGPGNLEDPASRFGAAIDGTLDFKPLGINGLRLDFEAEVRESQLDDPLTGEKRRIQDDLVSWYEFEFRYDFPETNWNVGFNINSQTRAPRYRLDQYSLRRDHTPFAFGWISNTDIFGLTGTMWVGNLLDRDNSFTREYYDPNRNGALVRVEDRDRNFGPIVTFELKGDF